MRQRAIPETNRKSTSNILNLALSGGAFVLAAATLTGCATTQASTGGPPMGPMPVSFVPVRQADVPLKGEWVGTLDGYVNAQIQPQVSGYLVRQSYREGSPVAKGRRCSSRSIRVRSRRSSIRPRRRWSRPRGSWRRPRRSAALAQINLKRDTPLAEARAIAQSQLDNDKQQAAQAEAAVAAAASCGGRRRSGARQPRSSISGFTQVRSLIGGVAGQATTQVGNLVTPQSVLTSVSQLDPIKVYFSISDAEYLALVGSRAPDRAATCSAGSRAFRSR